MNHKVLIIDDERDLLKLLSYSFEKEGYTVEVAETGAEGIKIAKEFVPDVVILDVMMPEMDGIEVCELMRKESVLDKSFILFLSARGEDYSQVAGYRAGGDDYIIKPVRVKVLLHKITNLLQRNTDVKTHKSFSLDIDRFLVKKNGEEFLIPKKEFELLSFLMSAPDKVFKRQEILANVWGDHTISDRTIDVHVRKLRERFGNNIIRTVKGVGYRYSG